MKEIKAVSAQVVSRFVYEKAKIMKGRSGCSSPSTYQRDLWVSRYLRLVFNNHYRQGASCYLQNIMTTVTSSCEKISSQLDAFIVLKEAGKNPFLASSKAEKSFFIFIKKS